MNCKHKWEFIQLGSSTAMRPARHMYIAMFLCQKCMKYKKENLEELKE